MLDSTTPDDSTDGVLTEHERQALQKLQRDDDPELARIGDKLLQSFKSTEETN